MATNSKLFDEALKTMIPYVLRREKGMDGKHKEPRVMVNAFTTNGKYIGNARLARRLVKLHGVMPKKDCKGSLCRMGQSEDGKWYGWNPKYYCGFKPGDTFKRGSVPVRMLGFEGEIKVETEEHAKHLAHILATK